MDGILLTSSNMAYVSQQVQELNDQLALKNLGSLKYFLGLEAIRTAVRIHLKQTKYVIDLLAKTQMLEVLARSTPMATGTKLFSVNSALFDSPSLLKNIVGALQYLTLTRPDINFIVNKLSWFLQSPTKLQWQACKRILKYIKRTTDHGLNFTPVVVLHVKCYAYVDWGSNIEGKRFTDGYCVYLSPNLL